MNANIANGSDPQAGKREWFGLAVLTLPTLLIALYIGVLFLALPHLSQDLGASGATVGVIFVRRQLRLADPLLDLRHDKAGRAAASDSHPEGIRA